MDVIGQGAIVFLSIVGGSYAIWLLRDCCKRKLSGQDRSSRVRGQERHSSRLDWLLELSGSATLLVVACAFLAISVNNSASDSVTAGSDCSLQIQDVHSLPAGRVSFDSQSPDSPIVGADLSNLPVTDDEMRVFFRKAPEIQWLNLTDTNITDACLAHLEHSRLTVLSMGHTAITDSGIKYVARNSSLEDLSLPGTQVTDAGLKHVRSLSKLRELDLQGTRVTDAGLKSLQQLDRLEILRLRNTAVTSDAIRDLERRLPRLTCSLRR